MPSLNWIGKDKVINYHNNVPYRVLQKKYSYLDEETENMIIHGDNLEALKSLLPKYEGKIKCIFIDPPYNTGNEGWIYNDNVNDPRIKKWLGEVVGSEGEDLSRHDKWLCMMYPRLRIMQKLLSSDGMIFISIDDNEYANLKMICDEIFGLSNFGANIIWEKVYSPRMDEKNFSTSHDYVLCYFKDISKGYVKKVKFEQKSAQFNYYDEKEKKYYRRRSLRKEGSQSLRTDRPNLYYPITAPDGTEVYPIKPNGIEGRWRWEYETYLVNSQNNVLDWVKTKNGWQVYVKQYADNNAEKPVETIWYSSEVGHTHAAADEIKQIFGKKVFDTPKPASLIRKIIDISTDTDSIILDAFAGSGTTAQAVIEQNASDGGDRHFIMIEMLPYAESIIAERIRQLNKKDELKGKCGFGYYELGEQLLVKGKINPDIKIEDLKEYIWYMETRSSFKTINNSDCKAFLGVYNNTAIYFVYDRETLTTLDAFFLQQIKTKADAYVIYADTCTLSNEKLSRFNITFKKIPRDIARL